RLPLRQRGSLVELRADLPVELSHRPAAAQCFGLVEPAAVQTFDGQQPDIVGPRQGERRGQDEDVGPRWMGFNCCQSLAAGGIIQFGGYSPRLEFSRRCLEYLPTQVERPHEKKVRLGEAPAIAGGQVLSQALEQRLAILGACLAALLE